MRDFRHWKRYQGGWAQDLYLFDLESHEAERITDHPRSDRDPMWIGETIYFASDRDGRLNLYAYDPAAKRTEQLTRHDLWDLRWPSADAEGRIVYELAGELRIFDVRDRSDRPVPIRVPTDALAMRPARVSAAKQIESIALAPKGERALFAARGDVFSVPIEHGPTRNLTRSSGAHDREPAWSPDGRRVAFVSDRDGEEEIYLVAQDGSGEPRQLTDGNQGRLSGLLWSPDGERLAFRDQRGKLYVLHVASRDLVEVADDAERSGLSYSWSPRGGHLACDPMGMNQQRSIHVWSVADGTLRRVTDELWNERSPSWSPDGSYLYFLGDRQFQPQIGSFEWNYAVDRETYVYALALRRDVPHPFPPRSDEVSLDGEKKEKDGGDGESGKKGKKKKAEDEDGDGEEKEPKEPIRIDFEGLGARVARVPVEADNYLAVLAVEKHLLIARGFADYYGRKSDRSVELVVYSLADRKETTIASDVDRAALSADGKKILVGQEGSYRLLDVKPEAGQEGKAVSTAGLMVDRVPAEEWRQIFDEVWRRFRDYFYVENMHGYDWRAIREQYRPLLAHVAHRSDLNYVLSEMIAELNASHTYVTGGDYEIPPRPKAALLGAKLELDAEAGRYRIARIYPGHNEEPNYRSPLTEVGVEVAAGDYLLAINGVELTADENPYRLLRHAGGGPVELRVGSEPTLASARKVMVEPIASEDDLLYLAWVESNRRYVAERTGGRVGYLHLPNMGSSGIREWIKWYYGQIRKAGLVIDVRSNGGGNVSQWILERLRRQLLMFDFERNVDYPDTYPDVVFHGHLVCLLDEDTASDGDQFAWVFRQSGLGPLVGKRSWGGVVGIYGGGPLVDGGGLSVPEAGSADAAGRWVIEGHGVDPDIVVENDPKEVLAGRDQQLERAVEVILEKLEAEPRPLPPRPEPPVKTE